MKSKATITELAARGDFGPNRMESQPKSEFFQHGSGVAALIGGPKLGICKECHVRFVLTNKFHTGDSHPKWAQSAEALLSQLVTVLDEIMDPENNREGRAVINMSFAFFKDKSVASFYTAFCKLFSRQGSSWERNKFLIWQNHR